MYNIANKIVTSIYGHGRGWCFSGKDFQDIGLRKTIDSVLHRLAQKGTIRRVSRGLYDYPEFSNLLNKTLSPNIDQVARAFSRKHGWRLQATGAMAANLLGISTHVPAKVVYLTDGPGKTIKIGNTMIQFKRTAPKDLNVKNKKSAIIIQALKFLGKDHIDKNTHMRIRSLLSDSDRKKLLKDARYGTDWVFETIKQICFGNMNHE